MLTMTDFCRREHITADVQPATDNPHMTGMPPGSKHWLVQLRSGSARLEIPFSTGPVLGTPTVEDVLDCLASDAVSVESNPDFDDWASDLGYDPDSRKAFDTFGAVLTQARLLARFLGDDAFDTLLYKVER